MRIAELPHGEAYTLHLTLETSPPEAQLPMRGEEVSLHFSSERGPGLLRWRDHASVVSPVDGPSRQRLDALRTRNPARLLWVVTAPSSADGAILLSAHQFNRAINLGEGLTIAVDERAAEAIQRISPATASVDQACRWLLDEVCIPPSREAGPHRIVATGDPEQSKRLRLLGRHFAVDVEMVDQRLTALRVAPPRRDRRRFRPPEFLLEAALSFVDASLTSEASRAAIQAQLNQLLLEANNSYLALWQRYQDLERAQLMAHAREVGFVHYYKRERRPSGAWRFFVKEEEDPGAFCQRALREETQLEAGPKLPAQLLDPQASEEKGDGRASFVGDLVSYRQALSAADIKPMDDDHAPIPPAKGLLFSSLRGDQVRLRRREQAISRLKSATAHMPQLAQIIEGQPARTIRPRAFKPLCKVSRAAFNTEPTQAQREAIDRAINTPDIALIQGPPGTGKTTVIAAIEARLAELREAGEEPAGRVLLTSYQHDAVDNAVDRTRVYGLPPARFGGRMGSQSVQAQAERFAAELRTKLKAQLADQPQARPLSFFRQVRDTLAGLLSGGGKAADALALVELLLSQPAPTWPQDLWESLRQTQAALSRQAQPIPPDSLVVKAIRGIRCTDVSFGDDGPARARRALSALDGQLSDEETSLLQKAGDTPPHTNFDDLAGLETLKASLLDRVTTPAAATLAQEISPELLTPLKAAAAHLRARLERSPAGVPDALEELSDLLNEAPGEVVRTLRHYSAVYAATCQQAVGRSVRSVKGLNDTISFNTVIVDEAARANPLDLFIPMSVAQRRIILVGDHRQLPHLLEPSVEAELAVDPSSAMSDALKESLFERLFHDLKKRQSRDGFPRVVTLDQQFRMHPVLGGFVSQTFYAQHNEGFSSPRPASDFHHSLKDWSRDGRPLCAGWKHIPLSAGREQRVGHSLKRRAEARWIGAHVKALVEGDGRDLTIGVITFYSAQVTELKRAMLEHGLTERDDEDGELRIARPWRDLERPDGSRVERLRVGTVDAFQGMEFDVVLLSVVRASKGNNKGTKAQRARYGHLMLPNRLCVAMSRQKRLLIVVGDAAMFSGEEAQEIVPGLARFHALCGEEHGYIT